MCNPHEEYKNTENNSVSVEPSPRWWSLTPCRLTATASQPGASTHPATAGHRTSGQMSSAGLQAVQPQRGQANRCQRYRPTPHCRRSSALQRHQVAAPTSLLIRPRPTVFGCVTVTGKSRGMRLPEDAYGLGFQPTIHTLRLQAAANG